MPAFKKTTTLSELEADYHLVDSLYKGTSAMKEAGQTYLPIADGEDPNEKYPKRLARSVLFNRYRSTIDEAVGRAFSNGVEVNGMDSSFNTDNINGEGEDLDMFLKGTLKDAIHYGIDYIVVDYPVLTPNATLADEIALGVKPYFINVKAPNVLETRWEYFGSTKKLTYFRFVETDRVTTIDNGWETEEEIQQVKIFRYNEEGQMIFQIWRKNKDGKVFLYDENAIVGPSMLPIVPVYGAKKDFYTGAPMLLDLAELNLAHWQDYSDLRYNQNLTLNPIMKTWGLAGVTDEAGNPVEIKAAPDTRLDFPGDKASYDAAWMEITGAALDTALKNLKDLEDKMDVSALQLTKTQPINSATEAVLDEVQRNSKMDTVLASLQSAVQQALTIWGEYTGQTLDVEVKIKQDIVTQDSTNITDVEKGINSTEE